MLTHLIETFSTRIKVGPFHSASQWKCQTPFLASVEVIACGIDIVYTVAPAVNHENRQAAAKWHPQADDLGSEIPET